MSHSKRIVVVLVLTALTGAAAENPPLEGGAEPAATPRKGFLGRMGDVVAPVVPAFLKRKPATENVEASIAIEPADFSVKERREIEVTFSVANRSRRIVKMDFPTSQRIEVVLRDPAGKPIFQWSEDHLFQPVAATVVINPNERIEYKAAVPTRDMVGGRTYAVEAMLVGRPDITAAGQVTPR